jgi:hypothetical protein
MSAKNNVNPDHYKVAGRNEPNERMPEQASAGGGQPHSRRPGQANVIPGASPVGSTEAPPSPRRRGVPRNTSRPPA